MVLAPPRSFATIIAIYSPEPLFLIGPSAALLFFSGGTLPAHTRTTGGSIINASGQVGALIAGVGITASLASGTEWGTSAFIWGCVPILLSGLAILGAGRRSEGRPLRPTLPPPGRHCCSRSDRDQQCRCGREPAPYWAAE